MSLRSAPDHSDGCYGSLEDHVRYRAGKGYYAIAACRCRHDLTRGRRFYPVPVEAERAARALLGRKIARIDGGLA